MDKYIKLSDAVWVLCKETCHPGIFCPDSMCVEMWDKFKDVPTADVVEVVRCKDCKWSEWYTAVNGKQYCYCMEAGASARTEMDYCSRGEREDVEKND